MKGNVRFVEHQIISELRMRKEYRIADMAEGAFRYYRWQMEMLREKNKNQLLKVFISDDGGEIKQLYNGEEVEKIVKERDGLKVELRDRVDYIHEQDEVIKDYKHRAEVTKKALLSLCDRTMERFLEIFFKSTNTLVRNKQELCDYYIKQAEKELSEEEKE